MLTIMYRDENGAEVLYEAETVEVVTPQTVAEWHNVHGNDTDCPPEGITVRGIDMSDVKKIHYYYQGGHGKTPCQPVVFVMNRYGATVAKHLL